MEVYFQIYIKLWKLHSIFFKGYTIIHQLDACFFDGSRKKQRKITMVKSVFI